MLVSPATGSLRRPVTLFARSMFTARKPDPSRPNWFRVSLAFGSSVALWTLLIQQHNEDVAEYKKRNRLE